MRLAAMMLVTACGAPLAAQSPAVRVHLEGRHDDPESALRETVQIDKAKGPEDEVMKRDELWLLAALYDRGYIQAKVGSSKKLADDGALDVTYRIEEGPRFRLRAIVVHEGGSSQVVSSLHRTRAGDWFSRRLVMEDLAELRTRYGNREITPEINVDANARIVDLDVVIGS